MPAAAGRGMLREALEALAEEAEDFWAPRRVERLDRPVTPLEFVRDYVQANVPVVLGQGCGLIDHWPALHRWKDWGYVKALVGPETEVTVNVTPTGRGDAILDLEGSGYPLMSTGEEDGSPPPSQPPRRVFVKPEERRMAFGEFVDRLLAEDGDEGASGSEVLYLSQQDDCLRREFPMLCDPAVCEDIDPQGLPLAREAFGNDPDAVNLWLGDARAVSSFHKDHYENLYAVVVGEKHFVLLPPCDAWALPEAQGLPQARFRSRGGDGGGRGDGFEVVLEPGAEPITWIDLDIPPSSSPAAAATAGGEAPALPRGLHPLEVRVRAGEVLYLPALWFHRVTQTCPTLAVNFWHDMRFDCKWVYFQLVGRLGQALRRLEGGEEEEEEEEGVVG